MVGLITGDDETHYREEAQWFSDNSLVLNANKTKEIVLDFRRARKMTPHPH